MKKSAPHVTIDPEYLDIFDAVIKRLETPLLPRYTRSGFMNKAAGLWVEAIKAERPDLKEEIEAIEARYQAQRNDEAKRPRKSVVPFARRSNGGGRRGPSA